MAPKGKATGADAEEVRRLVMDVAAVRSLAEVLEVAREAGVPAAPIKGVVLCRWLYDRLADRPYADLDLMVSRSGFARLAQAVAARGWEVQQLSEEMGELEFVLNHVVVEVHAEVGRRDLSRLTTDDVLARAELERRTFPFEIRRIDEVDHFFVLVANVTKKTFVYANRHQPADLEILIGRLEPRWPELIERARRAGFLTALRSTASWMIEEHSSPGFRRFTGLIPPPRRWPLSVALRLYRRQASRHVSRLESPSGLLGLALATLTPDDPSLRLRGLARLLRRGAVRRLGRHPG